MCGTWLRLADQEMKKNKVHARGGSVSAPTQAHLEIIQEVLVQPRGVFLHAHDVTAVFLVTLYK